MFQTAVQSVRFDTRAPQVLNTGGRISFALPVINAGTAAAENVIVTQISLGTAPLAEPALPLPIGDLGASNATTINAVFSSATLTPGARHPIVVRGTYRLGNASYGFTLNRFLIVPSAVPPPMTFLKGRVAASVDLQAGNWNYTIVNEEPSGSPRYLNAFSIDMAAPFTVTGTPAGWAVDTDNFSYVLWYVSDPQAPYPDHVPPGASRNGFRITSARNRSEARAFMLTSWNHGSDDADLVVPGTTLTPSRT